MKYKLNFTVTMVITLRLTVNNHNQLMNHRFPIDSYPLMLIIIDYSGMPGIACWLKFI
jgi:hypothetical protein